MIKKIKTALLSLLSDKEYEEFFNSELNFFFKKWKISETSSQISSNSDSEFKDKLIQIFSENSEKNNKWKERWTDKV